VADMLAARPWTTRAECATEERAEHFFPENLGRHLASPSVLLALLTCERCEARQECGHEAMVPTIVTHIPGEPDPVPMLPTGVWGGSVEKERRAALEIAGDPDAAAALLETTFPQRLEERVAAFLAVGDRNADGRLRTKSWQRRRVEELLAEREDEVEVSA